MAVLANAIGTLGDIVFATATEQITNMAVVEKRITCNKWHDLANVTISSICRKQSGIPKKRYFA